MAAGRADAARRPLHRRASSRSRRKPSNVAKCVTFTKGDVEAGFDAKPRSSIERRYTTQPVHQAYIEPHACVVSVARRRPVHDLELEPGPVHGARLLRQAARHRHRQYPRDPGRDRRRVRRQDARLSRAGRAGAVEEVRPPGQDRDEPRGGVPRHRPGRRRRRRGQARRQEGRHASSPPSSCSNIRPAPSRARRSGRAACAALRCTTSRTSTITGYDVVSNRPKVAAYRAPGAPNSTFGVESCIDELARELEHRSAASCARSTPPRTAPRRRTARPGPISAICRRSRRRKSHPHLEDPARARTRAAASPRASGSTSAASRARPCHINEDGTASVVEGNPDIGGSRASMAMMAAEVLGIPYEQVRPIVGDTASIGFTLPDRRQPRHLRDRHGGDAGGREGRRAS